MSFKDPDDPYNGHPAYEPEVWNNDLSIRFSHNCYSYAANHIDPELGSLCRKKLNRTLGTAKSCKKYFPQPGRAAGLKGRAGGKKWSCINAEKGILADNPEIFKIYDVPGGPTRNEYQCPAGMYKIAMATKSDNSDFHFWREDIGYRNTKPVKTWSHKAGASRATNRDYSLQIIKDPETSDRGKYDDFCGFYCVPNVKKNLSH